MDQRVDSSLPAKSEGLYAETTKGNAYYTNTYEPLSHHNARQAPFDVAKTWDNHKGANGRGGLRHS